MTERIVAEALSRFGCIRVIISLTDATIHVERWHRGPTRNRRGALDPDAVDALRSLALAVSQDEQKLMRGDFYADGEERLTIELEGHVVRLHNDTARIDTPAAQPLLQRCYDLSDSVLPHS